MEFRPCIDIHNGRVKQIVGGTLSDKGNYAAENYVAQQDGAFYARLYRDAGIRGGHVIMLNGHDSEYYNETKRQALAALQAYPGGLQIGGGITPDNAWEFLEAGASHVIVTSYVFQDGKIHFDKLKKLCDAVGKDCVVLDLSCRRTKDGFQIVTDRWQKLTGERLDDTLLDKLYHYCDEFLIHGVDVEGKAQGIEEELVSMLGHWGKCTQGKCPITYAGGVHNYEDLKLLKKLSCGYMNVTIGSGLDLFGGSLSWKKVLEICRDAVR